MLSISHIPMFAAILVFALGCLVLIAVIWAFLPPRRLIEGKVVVSVPGDPEAGNPPEEAPPAG